MAEISDKTMPCDPKRRGRPLRGTEDARRQVLLAAAEDVFLERGFEATSMDDVAKRAGVSKKTIYGFVDAKEKLFEAVMQARIADSRISQLPDAVPTAAALEEALVQYFIELARFVLSPISVQLFRAVAAEAVRFPAIAETYFREGPSCMIDTLSAWLAARVKQGQLILDDHKEAAAILGGSAVAGPLRNLSLGIGKTPTKAALEKRARTTVKLFLHGALTEGPRA